MNELYNFTKSSYVDLYHDANTPSNDPKIKGYFVVLMVKPDLNILTTDKMNHNIENPTSYSHKDQIGKLFRGTINTYVANNLTQSAGNYFSSIVSNKAESISYPDIGSNSEDTLVTLDKSIFKLPVTETGKSGMTFQIKFRENEGHDVLRMMSIWHTYIHAVTRGNLSPKQEYLDYNIIDYKSSIYTIHLKPDFRTITMWSKYTGIYPTNVPLSIMSEDIAQIEDVALNVEFAYDKFEWMNEDLLREINLLCSGEAITRTTMQQQNAYNFVANKNQLISRIKDTPFYQLDFNGLKMYLTNPSVAIEKQAASIFGTKASDESDMKFAAPLTAEMVDVTTNYSISRSNRKNKNNKHIEKRY